MVFVPIDLIVHSRAWKAQVPYLARTCRVVTDRPARQRPLRPADRPGGVRRAADASPTPSRCSTPSASSARCSSGICSSAWEALLCAALHPDRVPGCRRPSGRGPATRLAPHAAQGGRRRPVRRGARRRRGLGEDEPALLAARLAGLRGVLLQRDLHRAALDQARSRTWSATPASRPPRCSSPRSTGRSAPRRPATRARRCCAASRCPVLVVHGTEDQCSRSRAGRAGGRADRRTAGHARKGRATSRRAATRCAVNLLLQRVRRPVSARQPPAAALDPGHGPAPAGALPVVADRARPRPPRPGDRAGSCASGGPTSSSTGSPRSRWPASSRARASRCTRRPRTWPARAGTSRARPASTTCTPSRRSARWTRCWSRTSWCSTTWSPRSTTTCGWATRPGTSTTSCTRTRSSSGRRSPG